MNDPVTIINRERRANPDRSIIVRLPQVYYEGKGRYVESLVIRGIEYGPAKLANARQYLRFLNRAFRQSSFIG